MMSTTSMFMLLLFTLVITACGDSPVLPTIVCTTSSDDIKYSVGTNLTTNKVILKLQINEEINFPETPQEEEQLETTSESYVEARYDYAYHYHFESSDESDYQVYAHPGWRMHFDENDNVVLTTENDSSTTEESPLQESEEDFTNLRPSREEENRFNQHFCNPENDVETDVYMADTADDQQGLNRPHKFETYHGVGSYRFHPRPRNWGDARKVCEREDAYLAVINSEEEAQVFVSIMKRCPYILTTHFNDYAYLGVQDHFSEGEWETVKGDMLHETGYVKWAFNQPDNAHTIGENCLTMNRRSYFNDVPCYVELPFFCEAN